MSYTIYETFVGAGGSHLGFKKYGFKSKYVNDFNEDCLKTLLYNNPELKDDTYIDNSNILDVNPYTILQKTNMKERELDVLFGGIVCKGFSLAGERKPNDERNYFYHKQLELVKVVQPKISIIENVTGLINATVLSKQTPSELSNHIDILWKKMEDYKGIKSNLRKTGKLTKEFDDKGKELRKEKNIILQNLIDSNYLVPVMNDIVNTYASIGYRVYTKILNSAMYGAATKRERVIIVAVRNDLEGDFIFPEPTHINEQLKTKYPSLFSEDKKYQKAKTVNEALMDIDYTNIQDEDNKAMKHNEKTVERFKYIPQGENIVNYIDMLPEELKISKFYSRGNTMRLDGNAVSPTLVPGHSNFPIHPVEHRSITVREAACITGFPVDYKFFGNHTKRCEHVGNAVPPPLSQAIAKSVKEFLDC